jgi:hypothetical protein
MVMCLFRINTPVIAPKYKWRSFWLFFAFYNRTYLPSYHKEKRPRRRRLQSAFINWRFYGNKGSLYRIIYGINSRISSEYFPHSYRNKQSSCKNTIWTILEHRHINIYILSTHHTPTYSYLNLTTKTRYSILKSKHLQKT